MAEMLPIPPILIAIFFVWYALIGGAIGALSGRLTAAAINRNRRELFRVKGLFLDATFGAIAFVMSLIVIALLPWPRNTIVYYLEGGTQVTSTQNRYQYPFRVAYPSAIFLPALIELYKSSRKRSPVAQKLEEDGSSTS
jgi:hypothetical protein